MHRMGLAMVFACAIATACAAPADLVPVDKAESGSSNCDSSGRGQPASDHASMKVFQDCDTCPELVVIPAGRFTMGSPTSEPQRDLDEGPQHEVEICRPLAMSRYEVTFAEWDACVAERACGRHFWFVGPANDLWGRGNQPLINVSWKDAQLYAAWLSQKTRQEYRLPSEAEWEYAARAGTATVFSFGDELPPEQVNCDDHSPRRGASRSVNRGQTLPVGSFPPNGFGLYEMYGNVWEWVEDCYRFGYADAPSNGSARQMAGCDHRVLRGGSWGSIPAQLRSANRGRDEPSYRGPGVGFRVVRVLP